MMMIRKIMLIFTALSLTTTTFSQKNDFGIYYGIGGEIKLVRKLEMDIYTNVRTLDNASKIEKAFREANLIKKLNKNLSEEEGNG